MSEVAAHPDLLTAIKPPHGEMDGSGKFSPNLYLWCKKWASRYSVGIRDAHLPTVWRDGNRELWIGRMCDDGWFTGSRLWRVLVKGGRQQIWAIQPRQAKAFKPAPNFWRTYIRDGRCAIDREHKQYWQNDDPRWAVKGKTRTCQWCGRHKQRLRIRTETKRTVVKIWVNA